MGLRFVYLLAGAPITNVELAEIAACKIQTMKERLIDARVRPGMEVPKRLLRRRLTRWT
jgi:hypothetical protein